MPNSKTKIFIDGRVLSVQRGGVAKIVCELLAEFETCSHVDITCFVMESAHQELPQQSNLSYQTLTWPLGIKRFTRFIVENTFLYWRMLVGKPDVAIFPNYTMPLLPLWRRTKKIIGIWDITYTTHPRHYRWYERLVLSWPSKVSARRSDLVISCSEFDLRQVQSFYEIEKTKLHLLELNAAPRFFEYNCEKSSGESKFRQSLGVEGPYLLTLGVIYQRRAIPQIIEAFVQGKERGWLNPELQLLVAGKNLIRPKYDLDGLIDRYSQCGVRYVSFVPDEELESIYSNSFGYICLSEVDGEAVLIKEAAALGVPVLTTSMLSHGLGRMAFEVRSPINIENIISGLVELVSSDKREHYAREARSYLEGIDSKGNYQQLTYKILEMAIKDDR